MPVEQANDIQAGFVRVAVGVEDGLDVGAFGPFPEELFEFGLGFGLLKGEALLFDGEAAGHEVPTAEGDDVGEEVADFAQVGLGVFGDDPAPPGLRFLYTATEVTFSMLAGRSAIALAVERAARMVSRAKNGC